MAKAKKGGLGKGLDSLIPEVVTETTVQGNKQETPVVIEKEVVIEKKVIVEKQNLMIDINLIEPDRNQPRKKFDQDALEELADSIANYGVLQPILVQKKDDYYAIIAGERRWRAAKLARCKEVPVIIKEYSERERMEIALIENIQRENLNPIEEAIAYQSLIDEYKLKHEDIAERVSKSRSAITNSMRLLKLDSRVQDMLIEDLISMGHARALLGVEDNDMQVKIAEKVVEKALSVRETEKMVKNLGKPVVEPKKNQENPAMAAAYRRSEDRLKQILGTKVSIQRKDENNGKIEISYFSLDELERLMELLESCASY